MSSSNALSHSSASSASGLRVQVATFNANMQGAEEDWPSLTPWLVPTLTETEPSYALPSSSDSKGGRDAPDIYAVGFQELLPLHVGFAGRGDAAIKNTEREIRRAVRHHAAVTRTDGLYPPGGGPEDYALLARVDMVGIAVFVYARERGGVAARVKEIRTASAGTGLGGLMGNKGGVAVRAVLRGAENGTPDEVLTFVCAHLAAHDHNVPRRNADWAALVRRLVFASEAVQPLPPVQQASGLSSLTHKYDEKGAAKAPAAKDAKPLDKKEYDLYDTSHLFVFGDLNYRIALTKPGKPGSSTSSSAKQPLTRSALQSALSEGDWASLALHDQLAAERTSNPPRVFHGLEEHPLTETPFGPTYKYKVRRSGDKEKSQGEKSNPSAKHTTSDLSPKRVPGWTDRVLWASWADAANSGNEKVTNEGIQVELHRSLMQYTLSDHKPVTTILRLPKGTSSSTTPLRLRIPAPYARDPYWRAKRLTGIALDRLVGLVWCALIAVGAGSLVGGALELVVVAALSVWWLRSGGGAQGDMGWMLGWLGGNP